MGSLKVSLPTLMTLNSLRNIKMAPSIYLLGYFLRILCTQSCFKTQNQLITPLKYVYDFNIKVANIKNEVAVLLLCTTSMDNLYLLFDLKIQRYDFHIWNFSAPLVEQFFHCVPRVRFHCHMGCISFFLLVKYSVQSPTIFHFPNKMESRKRNFKKLHLD